AERLVDEAMSELRVELSTLEKKRAIALLGEDNTLKSRIVAQFKTTKRKGILLIGRSGAGKSKLAAGLVARDESDGTTSNKVTMHTVFAQRVVAVYDTPGQQRYAYRVEEAIRKHKPSIVVLVVADGYLDTDSPDFKNQLKHPDIKNKKGNVILFKNLD